MNGFLQTVKDFWGLCIGRGINRQLMLDLGLDAYVFLRFHRFALYFFVIVTPLSLAILAPVYATSNPQKSKADDTTDWLVWISLSNVPTRSEDQPGGVYAAPCVFIVFYTIIGMYLAIKEYQHYVEMKEDYLQHKMGPQVRSILVEGIPYDMSSRTAVKKYFESIFPGEVAAVKIVRDESSLSELQSAISDRESVITKLERAYVDSSRNGGKRTTVRVRASASTGSSINGNAISRMGCVGTKVDAIDYYNARLKDLNSRIDGMQRDIMSRDKETDCAMSAEPSKLIGAAATLIERVIPITNRAAAFVTFKHLVPRCVAVQTTLDEPLKLTTFPAPEPRDVSWGNLGLPPQRRCLSQTNVSLLVLFITLVFGALTSLISASTSVEQIRKQWKELDVWLKSHDSFVPFFQQIAPLLLAIVFSIVPFIYSWLLSFQRRQSRSILDNAFYSSYYVFLLLQVFLFYQISGTIFSLLQDWYKNPTDFIKLLGRSVPLNATFFLQYMMLKVFFLLPLEVLRVADLSVAYLVRPIFCGLSRTPRAARLDADVGPSVILRTFGTDRVPLSACCFFRSPYATRSCRPSWRLWRSCSLR